MKEREWNVEVLAVKLREQAAWESTKRAIVLDRVRTGLLEKKFLGASNRAVREESGSCAAVRGREGGYGSHSSNGEIGVTPGVVLPTPVDA